MNKSFIGTVISTKMNKTATVAIEKKFRHPLYRKVIVRHKKLKAQNDGDFKVGDVVKITETRPLSKLKHFLIVDKIK